MSDDIDKETEILKIVRRKAPGTVAIFDCKGFYRCYEDDVDILTSEILMSNVGVQYEQIDENTITFHNLNNAQYLRVLRDLLLFLRFRVELYEESAPEYENGPVKFILKAKGILGNLVDFEETLAECVEMAEMSTIACVRLLDDDSAQENKLVLVSANSQDLRIIVAQMTDTANFTELEQCIVSIQPRECILIGQNAQMAPNRFKKLEMAIQRTNIEKRIVNEEHAQLDLVEECKAEMQKLLHKKIDVTQPPIVWQTLYLLFSQMHLLDDRQYESGFFLSQYGAAGRMYMSNAVLQALDIFDIGAEIDSPTSALPNSTLTLYEHLNRCRSQPGKRLIRDWLRRPLFSHRQIEERLDVVQSLCQCPTVRQALHEDLLRRVPDIGQITRKLVQKKATLQDCYRLYQMVLLLHNFENCLTKMADEEDLDPKLFSSVKELILEQIQHSIVEFERFEKLIVGAIDLDQLDETGEYRIRPEMDDELAAISTQMSELDGEAEKLLPVLVDRLACEVKLESNSDLGFFFRIVDKFESNLSRVPDAKIVDSTKAGGVRFQTAQLDQLNDEYRDLAQKYEEGQAELLRMVIQTCAGYAPALHSMAERMGTLDVLTAFAIVAVSSPFSYVRPTILDKGSDVLDLRNCRHPMVENLAGLQFIPNNVFMGRDAECKRFMVLTGANMGGKSTYLKAAALTVLLGQMGCFVPCESATFSMIDGIYTRIGAGDFQCKGVSTFMAEMVDCATVLEKASSNSLILVDELGRGTSTYDGFGLAWAIAEDIIERIDCFTLFATHFHEISSLEARFPAKVKNYKMDTLIANGELTILYQVVPGISDRSFGLNIAEMVGIPREIIQEAENYLRRLETGDLPKEDDNDDEEKSVLKQIQTY